MRSPGFFSALVIAASVLGGVFGLEDEGVEVRGIDATVSCKQIAKTISSESDIYWPGGFLF